MDPLLTTEDVAEFFRMDVVTVRRMINKGELPAYRVGGEYRFKRIDIDEYLERQRVPVREEARGHLERLSQHVRKLVPLTVVAESFSQFSRFTKRARTVLMLAQEEALQLNHHYLGTEHLLLGLVREGEGVGGQLLREAGCTVENVRQVVQEQVGRGEEGEPMQGELPVTPRVKKVIELAVDEARRLNHHYVGTEHLVLGLLREGEGVAGRLLRDRGIELSEVRGRIREMLAR